MGSARKILVIDDDKSIRNTLALALKEEGFDVDTAENGKEAINKSYSSFYNLAIVDWRLPDIQGTDLLTKLKETTPKMAKIMLTGYPSMDNAIDSVNNHADAFLLKPVHFEVLLEKVRELLRQQEQDNKFSEEKMTNFIETRVKMISEKE
ncbi:MAG: response regulator transcription factor [Candidatus Bathyarchaeia archaeon]|jgi:DNA-binding response OmpR family regulator